MIYLFVIDDSLTTEQLTCELLQKMRAGLGACKIDLSLFQ